jgi:exosome complex RNA-binding protein Rrp42 (RNase PH superfamily)
MFGRHRRQYTKQIARSLNYVLNNPKCFDLNQLCVVKGQHCWLVHVDISVSRKKKSTLDYFQYILLFQILRYEGNLHDACSFAMKAALSETK